jgi:hypothetical protein
MDERISGDIENLLDEKLKPVNDSNHFMDRASF